MKRPNLFVYCTQAVVRISLVSELLITTVHWKTEKKKVIAGCRVIERSVCILTANSWPFLDKAVA
jgi:hypothetical protein